MLIFKEFIFYYLNFGVFMLKKTLLIAVFLCAGILFAQDEKKDDFKWFGTVYLRPNLDARDFSNKTHPIFYTMQRIAFGFEKEIWPNISVYAQAMDSRVWGQPQNARKSIANLDLHQGYVKFDKLFGAPVSLKLGRMEYNFVPKILANSNWQDVPSAFDGFDATFKLGESAKLDVFGAQVVNSNAFIALPQPSNYTYPAAPDPGYYMGGATLKWDISKGQSLVPIIMHETQSRVESKYNELTKTSVAADYFYKNSKLDIWLHGGYMMGKTVSSAASKSEKNIAAFGAHAFIGYNLGIVKPVLLIDINSGTKKEDQAKNNNLYISSFSGKHIFLGDADYFVNMATATQGLGVNDFGAKFIFNEKNPLSFYVAGHYFLTNVPGVDADLKETSDLGTEIDLNLKYTYSKKMFFDWGVCAFMPGEITKQVYKISDVDLSDVHLREDMGLYSYFRIMFNF